MTKPQSIITRKSRTALIAISGIALALGAAEFRAQATEWDKKTILTVNEPMQIRDTLLEPGQYVLKLADTNSRDVVQIFNADQTHLINTVMAIPDYRLQLTGNARFVMWETPAGSVKALKTWFYPGDNFGAEFPYPKHLQQIALAEPAGAPFSPSPAAASPAAAPAPQEPAIQPQASAQEPPSQQPVEIAQNSPPPAPTAAPEPPPQSPATTTPAELPKTASPYPIFGFTGLLLLGAGALLRQTHSA